MQILQVLDFAYKDELANDQSVSFNKCDELWRLLVQSSQVSLGGNAIYKDVLNIKDTKLYFLAICGIDCNKNMNKQASAEKQPGLPFGFLNNYGDLCLTKSDQD